MPEGTPAIRKEECPNLNSFQEGVTSLLKSDELVRARVKQERILLGDDEDVAVFYKGQQVEGESVLARLPAGQLGPSLRRNVELVVVCLVA